MVGLFCREGEGGVCSFLQVHRAGRLLPIQKAPGLTKSVIFLFPGDSITVQPFIT